MFQDHGGADHVLRGARSRADGSHHPHGGGATEGERWLDGDVYTLTSTDRMFEIWGKLSPAHCRCRASCLRSDVCAGDGAVHRQ